MRISSTPWELIWLLSLFVFIVSLVWSGLAWIRRRKLRWFQAVLLGGALVALLAIPGGLRLTNYRFKLGYGNSEATRTDHKIPDLVTREYTQYNIRQVYEASLRAVQSAKTYGQPWTVTFAGMEVYRVARLEVDVPVFFSKDRLTVTIQLIPNQPGLRVIVFSISDRRERDYGENARHIKQFYEALEAELEKIQ